MTTSYGDRVAVDLHGLGEAPAVLFIQGAGLERTSAPGLTKTAHLLSERGF